MIQKETNLVVADNSGARSVRAFTLYGGSTRRSSSIGDIIKCAVKGEAIAADWCGGIAEGSVVLSGVNQDVAAEGTLDKINEAIAGFKAGTLNVFDTKNFTVGGETLTTYKADVDTDAAFEKDTEVIINGVFVESGKDFRSAPYFDLQIDGIKLLNQKF